MTDNVINLGADEKLREQNEQLVNGLFGPTCTAASLIVEGRVIPNITIHRDGGEVVFVLDQRLGFGFPKEWAYQAACLAANAMAIGAGYTYLGGETKERAFAPRCFGIELPGEPA